MDTELRELYDDIVHCLIKYGQLKKDDAQTLLDGSGLFESLTTEASRAALVHETGYYWAMNILHAKDDPRWFQNPELWPPPDDYYESTQNRLC